MRAPDNLGRVTQHCEQTGGRHRGAGSLVRCSPPGPHPPSASAAEPGVARLRDPGLRNLQARTCPSYKNKKYIKYLHVGCCPSSSYFKCKDFTLTNMSDNIHCVASFVYKRALQLPCWQRVFGKPADPSTAWQIAFMDRTCLPSTSLRCSIGLRSG